MDGGIAIHNPKRQHLPIKMLHLEFPPEHVHVAFTTLPPSTTDFVSDSGELALAEPSRFAVMGDYGNCVNVYDARTFIVQHQIAGGH